MVQQWEREGNELWKFLEPVDSLHPIQVLLYLHLNLNIIRMMNTLIQKLVKGVQSKTKIHTFFFSTQDRVLKDKFLIEKINRKINFTVFRDDYGPL